MPARTTTKEPSIRGDHRTIMLGSQRQVYAVPKRHLIVERKLQSSSQQWAGLEIAQFRFLHQTKRFVSLLR